MEEPEVWRWIWLVAAAGGVLGEIVTAGSFVLLPFGIGAGIACLLAFADVSLALQWLAFVVVAMGGFAGTRPLARRLDANISSEGIGSNRWAGQPAIVLNAIPAGIDETGLVRIGREEWRAMTANGAAIDVGTRVKVLHVTGTRLVVVPDDREPALGPGRGGVVNAAIVLGVLALVLLAYVFTGIKMVRPFQRGVVERLGKYRETVEPGLRIIVPFLERMTLVDMREQVIDVPPQEVITSDNVVVEVDAVVYYEATDAQRLVFNVGNFLLAVTKLAQTNLRNVVGDLQLDEALTSRDKINLALREILDDATDKWGVRVVRVELQRVEPPPDVMASMHEVMRAERNRRATVTEALGVREAAITRAEGEKQAAILSSEGEASATRQLADAERYRQETVAEGEAAAIRNVFQAIHDGNATPDILALKYYEALQVVAAGQATKIFLPAGADGFAGTVAGLAELVRATNGDG